MSEETPIPPPDEPTSELPAAKDSLDDFDFDFEETVAPPRRRRLPLITAGLALCAAVGAGVVGGILIQKHWGGSGSDGGSSRAAALAAALGGRTTQTGASGAAAAGSGGFTRSGVAGQVKAIDGTNLYVTDTGGNVVKVTTDPGTTVQVTKSGTLKSIAPGDFVVVQGTKTKAGYKATSISDTGASGGLGALGRLGNQSGSSSSDGSSGGGSQPSLPGLP